MRQGPISLLICAAIALACAALPSGGRAAGSDRIETLGPGVGAVTKLPVPRYVSLRSDRINVRRGPGLDYRIDWVFQRAGLPVRIVDEYGHWRRIADSDDAGGWVYHALLASRRTALITEPEVTFRAEPTAAAEPTARAEQGVVVGLVRCRPDWCELEAGGARGWVPKQAIWGVDPGEIFGE